MFLCVNDRRVLHLRSQQQSNINHLLILMSPVQQRLSNQRIEPQWYCPIRERETGDEQRQRQETETETKTEMEREMEMETGDRDRDRDGDRGRGGGGDGD